MNYLVIVLCGGRSVACASTERIKRGVSRADDIVVQNLDEIIIHTKFPSEFITAFYTDGFTNKMEIHPCGE